MVASKAEAFRESLGSVLDRVSPHPRMVTVIDPKKRAGAERSLMGDDVTFSGAAAVHFVSDSRRRHLGAANENDARARAWEFAGIDGSLYPVCLYLEDRYRFVRSFELRDPAYVLEQNADVVQMTFPSAFSHLPDGELRGGGAVRWRQRPSGFSTAPFLIRPWYAKAFPWPDSTDDLETGIRGSIPNAAFGAWGNGDPWTIEIPSV